jgi:hypothetical protein
MAERNIAGLWTRTVKDGPNKGQKFMAGKITTAGGETITVRIYKNLRKKTEKSPDFLCYVGDSNYKPDESSPHEEREIF